MLRVVGIGESKVDQLIQDLMGEGRNPEVALLASEGEIQVLITALGAAADRKGPMDALEQEIRQRLGRKVFGADDETLEETIGGLLQALGLSLAVVDTFTAGRLAMRLHDLEDALLRGSMVLPDEASAARWAGEALPEDLEEGARVLARTVRERVGTDLGLALAARFDAKGGPGTMKGTVVVEGEGLSRSFAWEAGGPPGVLRRRGAVIGLNTLRIALLEAGDTPSRDGGG